MHHRQQQEQKMAWRHLVERRVLSVCTALLTGLPSIGLPLALRAEPSTADAPGASQNAQPALKLSERFKDDLFWITLPDAEKEILDHFGINAASKLYRYAASLEALLIELGATISKPLPSEEAILDAVLPDKDQESSLLRGMNRTSVALIHIFGNRVFSALNAKSNNFEDEILDRTNKSSLSEASKRNIQQRLQSISQNLRHENYSLQATVEQSSGNQPDVKAMAERADRLSSEGKYSEAAAIWQQILTIAEKSLGPDDPIVSTFINNIALLLEKQGQYAAAEPLYRRSLTIYERSLGLDHPSVAESLNNLAGLFQSQGQYAAAEPLYRRSLAINEKVFGPNHPSVATSINNLALLLKDQGQYAAAESFYRRSLDISKKTLGPDNPSFATSLNNLAELLHVQGQHTEAETLYRRSLAIYEQVLEPDHTLISVALNNLAGLLEDQGQYASAESLYRRSLAIDAKGLGPNHPSVAMSLNNLAGLLEDQGQYAAAETLYRRSLAIYEQSLGLDHPLVATSLNNLGLLRKHQGQYSEAELLSRRALAIRQKALGPDHSAVATSLNNIGLILSDQGQYAAAEPLLRHSLAIYERSHGPDHPSVALGLNNLAYLLSNHGRYLAAEPLYHRSLAIYEQALGPDHPSVASILNNLALVLNNKGQTSSTIKVLHRSIKIESAWLLRELPLLPDQSRSAQLHKLGNAWELPFGLIDRNESATQLALETRLARHGLLPEIEQRQALLLNSPGVDRAKLDQLQVLTEQLASVSLPPERRTSVRDQRDNLQRELYRQIPELEIQPVTSAAVAKALPADGALVEFQRYRPFDGRKPKDQRLGAAQYIALVLKPDGSINAVPLGPAEAIDATVQKGLLASAKDLSDAEAIWAQLSNQVLKPLLPQLSGSRQWFLSPDAELNRVPFAALPAPQQPNTRLAQAVQLRLLTTGRELLRLQQPATAGNAALVMANPSYDRPGAKPTPAVRPAVVATTAQRRSAELGSTQWTPLPASEREGQQVASLLGTGLISGTAATTTSLQRQQGPRVLHVATHGFFVADQESKPTDAMLAIQEDSSLLRSLRQEDPQLRSGLVLAGANQPALDSNDDGYLTAAEALNLNLKGTELVVLSACSTGQGEARTGEGVYGLQRSLTVAGARSTLLSLWKVNDAATAEFMTRYYTRLKAGEARSDALAATQREFRDGTAGGGQWKDPYYWAAWQLVGDWRPIPGL